MNLLSAFQQAIRANHLFAESDKLLLAVSGGVDSVVLCELCRQAGYDFIIAHCNFQLRGEESARDESFARALGERYGVRTEIKRFETDAYANLHRVSIQEAARELRYNWFREMVHAGSGALADWIITAHHADDNVETLVMNFFRGTGLHGLTGIPASNDRIRRPLLAFSKQELITFARENQLAYVEDSSNLSNKYTRNYFRNEILPQITRVYPEARTNLLNNIARFREIEKLYTIATRGILDRICRVRGNEVHIPIKQLLGYDSRALIYEIISGFGFVEKQVDELLKLTASESGRYIDSPQKDFRIIKHRHWLIISPIASTMAENIIVEDGVEELDFPGGALRLSRMDASRCQLPSSVSVACLDARRIEFPLLLRKWKTGDYFYPLGMKKKKKLARFFIDQKFSKTDKEKVWVLEMNKKIVWVVGQRIDDRFKLTDSSKQALRLTLVSGQTG
jgi:tRNA(Ile)-lysidine synthase